MLCDCCMSARLFVLYGYAFFVSVILVVLTRKYNFVFIYSGVSQVFFENVISPVFACVYELIIDNLSGKQQSACFSLRVRLVERGSPHSLPLMESGKVPAGLFTTVSVWLHLAVCFEKIKLLYLNFILHQILPGVRIIIANPETKGPLGDSHLGEVSSYWKTKLRSKSSLAHYDFMCSWSVLSF